MHVPGVIPYILAGNHGLEVEGCGLKFTHPGAIARIPEIENICSRLDNVLQSWPGAFVERKGLTATVHFRAVCEEDHRELRRMVRRALANNGTQFGVRSGKRVLEVHPRLGWNKGSAVNWVRRQLEIRDYPCICIGDDVTDESMFGCCSPSVNILAGTGRRSLAKHTVRDTAEVQRVLATVLQMLDNRSHLRTKSLAGQLTGAIQMAQNPPHR